MLSRIPKTIARLTRLLSNAPKIEPPKPNIDMPKTNATPLLLKSCNCWKWLITSAALIGGVAYYLNMKENADKKMAVYKALGLASKLAESKPIKPASIEVSNKATKPTVPVEKPKEEKPMH